MQLGFHRIPKLKCTSMTKSKDYKGKPYKKDYAWYLPCSRAKELASVKLDNCCPSRASFSKVVLVPIWHVMLDY
jgi:hypothetical protein